MFSSRWVLISPCTRHSMLQTPNRRNFLAKLFSLTKTFLICLRGFRIREYCGCIYIYSIYVQYMHYTQSKVRVCRFWGLKQKVSEDFSPVNGHFWPWAATLKQATFYQFSARKQATGWADFFSKCPVPALAIRVTSSTYCFQWIPCAWVLQIWIPHWKAKLSVTIKSTTLRDNYRMQKHRRLEIINTMKNGVW